MNITPIIGFGVALTGYLYVLYLFRTVIAGKGRNDMMPTTRLHKATREIAHILGSTILYGIVWLAMTRHPWIAFFAIIPAALLFAFYLGGAKFKFESSFPILLIVGSCCVMIIAATAVGREFADILQTRERIDKEYEASIEAIRTEDAKHPRFYRIVYHRPSGDSDVYSPVEMNSTTFDGPIIRFVYQGGVHFLDHFKVDEITAPKPAGQN